MILRQVIHDDLGCASYLIGDPAAGVAAVVDPKLDVREYLTLARYLGVRIAHVLETHTHADHVSGHGRLVAATGATIHIHRDAEAGYPHEPFDDGWELVLGSLVVRALHTPGHRPEHTAFALVESDRGPEPWAVLTGDTLLVGDIARPDLAVEAEDGARAMHRSLHEVLLALPDTCEVWPGHLGGSLCGGPGLDMKVCSTIGYERTHNALLDELDTERFVALATGSLAVKPPNFTAIVERNRGPLGGAPPRLAALSPREVEAAGALVVDVRDERAFAAAHIPGAVCNPAVRAGFGTRLAWVACSPGQPVVLVGDDDEDATRAAELAAAVGIDWIGGRLAGGMASWHAEQRPVAVLPRIGVAELHARLGTVQVLDVRGRGDWEAGHVPGSLQAEYHELAELPAGIDPAQPVVVICASGRRSAIAASLLARLGVAEPIQVAGGGVGTWRAHGWPIESA